MAKGKREREHFEATALGHLEAVYRFAYYLCRDSTDAEDLTQDTFLSAFKKAHQFQPGTHLKAWLFRIARNAHIDRLRRKRREPELSPLQNTAIADSSSEPGPRPRSVAAWKALGTDVPSSFVDMFGDEVTRFLQELPVDFRLALVLCDVDDFSYQEIGEILDCPVGTVRSRISRARSQLREKLFEYAQDLGYIRPQEH